MEMFSMGGSINGEAYKKLVQKQLNNYIDSNMILSQLKFVAGEKDTLKMMAQNPLSFIPKAITKQLIPNTVKSVITEFDNQLKETAIAALNQVSGLQRSDNAVLNAIGKIFGVQNKISISSVDKGAYNKGATSWTGTDHQALTNVIPTLLRKIHSSISGSEELVFDYEKGTFTKLRDMETQFKKDDISRKTSLYSDYKAEFKEFLEQNVAADRKQREQFSEDFEKFLVKLTMDSAGGRTFRKGGRSGKEAGRDDIRDLMGKTSSEDASVKLVRAYLEGMVGVDNAKLTALFGRLPQEQRALVDRTMREMQADPVKYNTMYMNTGLGEHSKSGKGKANGSFTDSHLNYAKDGTTIIGATSGIASGVTDKFGHNQTYYLREILQTLNTGIYVVPVGGKRNRSSGNGEGEPSNSFVDAISARRRDVITSFRTDKDRYESTRPRDKTSSYTSEKREKDKQNGKLDVSDEFNLDQAKSHASAYHTANKSVKDSKPGAFAQLLSMVPEDTGLGKILAHLNSGVDKSKNVVTDAFKKADSALFAIVFGDENGQRGIRAIFDKTVGTLKAGFVKFSTFIDAKIISPLEESLFGDDGLFNKIKQTEFWKTVSSKFKDLTSKAGTFLLGEKGSDGLRSGGLFSETANELKNMGANVKIVILGEKGPDGKPLPLEQDNSVVGNIKRMFNNVTSSVSSAIGLDADKPKESLGTRISTGIDAVFDRLKERTNEFSDNVFGQTGNSSEFVKQFKEDMKGQKGYVGASAVLGAVGTMVFHRHMGLLGSMFLPGGPIGGALLGAGIGIASKSTGLKNYLFGPEDQDENGNTYRTGGLITKEVQDFFKNNKTGITVGSLGGLAATYGLLPSFFFPGGPIGGALVGGAVSLATKTTEFQNLLYGEGGTKDNPTGGITAKLKQIFGKDKNMKGLAIDAGIGAGVGLVGSFFLPGGPILNALLGSALSVGTATDKFKTWFFGEDDGTGKRKGGVLTKFTDFTKEKLFTPLAKSVKIAQNHIMGFVEENMVIPFKYAIDPIVTEAKHLGGVIKKKVDGLFNSVKESIHTNITKPIGEAVDKHFIQPLKNTLSKIFGGLGKIIGNIIAAPFRAISGVGKSAYEGQKKRGVKGYEQGVDEKYKSDRDALLTDENGKKLGFFARLRKTPERVSLWSKMNKEKYDKDKRNAAQFSDQGAYYERGQTVERYERQAREQAAVRARVAAKDMAIRNGTSVSAPSYTPPTGGTNSSATKVSTNQPSGISASEFARRTGLSRAEVRRMIKSGEIQATKNGESWSIPESVVDKFKTKSTNATSPNASAKSNTTGAFKNKTKKSETTSGYEPDNTKVSVSPADQSSKSQGTSKSQNYSAPKIDSDFYTSVKKDVSQIANSVYGQLNGVGSNINKIYRLLLKKFGEKDEDIKGDNNKSYVGFFGRIRTALNRPFQAIGNIITAPFRKIADIGHSFVKRITNIGGLLSKAGKSLISGLGGIAKGVGSILKELVKLPLDIAHTALSAIRSALPAIGEVLKTGVSLLGDGLKVAGSVVVDSVQAIGNTIAGAAKGFGQLVGGAMSGLGSILKSVGLIGAEALKGLWTGAKAVGKTALNVVGNVASAPFKLLSGAGKGLLGRGKVQHVIVDSGTLDLVKTVKKVKEVKGLGGSGGNDGGKPIKPIKPAPISTSVSDFTGGFGRKKQSKLHVIVDGVTKSAIRNIMKALGSVSVMKAGALPDLFGLGGGEEGTPTKPDMIDNNAGDTSVSTNLTAGGPADDDTDKTDNVEATGGSAIGNFRDKMSEKIANRQSQVDKGSRTSLLSRFAAADKDKEESEFRTKMLTYLGRTSESTEEHKSLFSSIFSKKGLITAGIIALLPIFIKLFKNLKLGDLLVSLAKTVTDGWSEIGGISGAINNLKEKITQGESVATGEETTYQVDDDGNLVYDEDGNLVTETNKVSRISAALTPTRTRIDTETGKWENKKEWTGTSGTTVKLAGKGLSYGIKKVDKALNSKAGKAVVKGTKKVASTAVSAAKTAATNFVTSGRDYNALKAAGSAFASEAGTAQKVAGKVVGVADNAVSSITKVADNAVKQVGDSKVIQTFIEKGKSAIEFLISKLAAAGEKLGLNIPVSSFDDITKMLSEKFFKSDVLAGFKEKIANFMGKISGRTVAIALDVGFAVYGVVNGAANAGYLFEVNSEDVDTKMRLISAVFSGLMSTTVGSIIDFINSMIYEILGMNFIKVIASYTYKLFSDDEDAAALDAKQEDFTKGYEDYVEKEYEAYVKSTEEQGQEAMSLEDFKASDLSTTRSEYNSNTNKSLFKRGFDAVKGVGKGIGNAVKGVGSGLKKAGSTVVSAVSGAGSWVKDKVTGVGSAIKNSKVGQAVSGGISTAKEAISTGVSTVFNKGKEIFSNVGSSISNIAKSGVDAAKGLATGYKTIEDNFYNKDNSFADYFKSDVNTVDEDNPFHGIVGGVLNIAKFTMFPKLLVAGILKKVGRAIADGVGKLLNTGKTVFSDYSTNLANINQLARSGDVAGLSSYEISTSEDDPLGGLVSGLLGVTRVFNYPVALVVAGGKKIVEGVKGIISGVKSAATDYSTNVSTLNQLSLSGDLDGLGNYEVTTSEDNPVSGFVSAMVGVSRIFHYPLALVVAGGKKIVEGVKGIVTTVASTGSQIITGSTDLGSLAISGDVEGLKGYAEVDEEGNPVGSFANAVLGVEKVLLTPLAMVTSVGKKIKSFIGEKVTAVKDYGTSVSTFVSKLNQYTDPDKDLSGWDNESMATSDDDVVGSVLSSIIKKVMWVYVGIVRSVKNAFDFVGDAVDNIKEGVSDTVDNVKEGVSNAASTVKSGASSALNWVSDKVNSAGTAIMNLGRGGNDGGRPVGGKGGSGEELNGMPYYSQNDPRYKNKPYRQTGGFGSGDDTIGDSGCGPTAMAMVASKFTGRDYNPATMARMAEDGGYSTSVGTTPGYFSAAGNALGIPNQQVSPTAESVQTSLANGNPVILQGAKGGSNNSPYTSEGHYVTATGIDGNNVIINDPRGKEYSGEYRMSDVMNDTTGAWSFGGQAGGFGSGAKRTASRLLRGGRGATVYASDTDDDSTSTNVATTALSKWISIVRAVKQAIAAQQLGYSQSRYTTITVGGRSIKVRTDCSGYVQTCLKYFGVMDEGKNLTSSDVQNAGNSTMKATGFTPYNWPGWDNLKEGDILGITGHTEIFAYNQNGQHYVYNCGSDKSCNSAVPTVSGHSAYKTIWRCGAAGDNALSSYAVDGSSTADVSYTDSSSSSSVASSSSGSSFSSFTELLSGLADAAISPIKKAFGLDTSDDSSTSTSTSSGSYDSSSSDSSAYTGTTIDAASVTGSSNAQKIWNYFTQNGYSKAATAAILGNAQQESGINPESGKSDSAVAHGIFQWETGRFANLKNYANKMGAQWYTIEPQIGYLATELPDSSVAYFNKKATYGSNVGHGAAGKTNFEVAGTTPTTFDAWKNSTDVDTATRQFEAAVERASWPRIDKRVAYAKGFYNEYANGGSGGLDGGRPIKRVSQSLSNKQNQIGGRGESKVSQVTSSIRESASSAIDKIKSNATQNTNDMSQMIKLALDYLSKIADNTGNTNTELEELNSKDFGGSYSQVNTTNNLVGTTDKSDNSSDRDKTADRSEYSMAKRVAAGLLS
jgi:excisionase family DNA binding protein